MPARGARNSDDLIERGQFIVASRPNSGKIHDERRDLIRPGDGRRRCVSKGKGGCRTHGAMSSHRSHGFG
jgi:hypothetical protein